LAQAPNFEAPAMRPVLTEFTKGEKSLGVCPTHTNIQLDVAPDPPHVPHYLEGGLLQPMMTRCTRTGGLDVLLHGSLES
jgi:hypothetical protein